MIWWLVDNATLVYLLLGVAAVALALRWRLTRRGKYLVALGAVAALVAVVVVLSLVVVTDRKRLVWTVEEVARRINDKQFHEAFRYFADEVRLELNEQKRTLSKGAVRALAEMRFKEGALSGIDVGNIDVEKVERPNAVVTFAVRPRGEPGAGRCQADFVLVGEGDWRVKALKIEFFGGGQFLRLPF
jgi:hypothetical protein